MLKTWNVENIINLESMFVAINSGSSKGRSRLLSNDGRIIVCRESCISEHSLVKLDTANVLMIS